MFHVYSLCSTQTLAVAFSFDGDAKKVNPMWFINQVEEIAGRVEIGDIAMKTIFRGAVKGNAAAWCRFISHLNYQEMRDRFLAKYWSAETQRHVIAAIHSGSFDGI